MDRRSIYLGLGLLAGVHNALAVPTTCNKLTPVNGIQPSVASGYKWTLAATGLSSPRTLQIKDNTLWVLESGKGVSKHTIVDNGCLGLTNAQTVVSDSSLNHGMVVSGNHVMVSNSDVAYEVTLSSNLQSVVPNTQKMLVTGMSNGDHVTRTLLLTGNSLIVSRGSDDNIDSGASNKTSGRAEIKMFDLTKGTHDYTTAGLLLGWGLRNDVGMAFHPSTQGLFTVENSADNIVRDGQDIHENNPAEEMNYLGVIKNGQMKGFKAKNYGYPTCFTAWDPSEMPNNANLTVGSPFALDSGDDAACVKTTQAARLSFQAHMAPIDIIFEPSGNRAWVSFHGSWDRDPPIGYGVAYVDFANGMPTQPPSSSTAANFVFGNTNVNNCPNSCFRPTGLALDSKGRLWVASDASGEIYVLTKS